jgi:RimJ/RimL family protein N-acetyltransferase
VQLLISREPVRPLRARVAVHNGASRAVLERCGFAEVSRDSGFAPGVGREVEEIVYVLSRTPDGN